MIDIAKKRLPQPAALVLVFLSFCAANWYSSRGVLAYYAEHYGWRGWFANDVWAFFIGGIVPLLLYVFISRTSRRALQLRVGNAASALACGIDLTVIAANVTLFALKFMYIAVPLAAPVIEIMINPAVMLAFVGLYLVYAFKMNYVSKSLFGAVAVQIKGMFAAVYGILAVVNIITAVIL